MHKFSLMSFPQSRWAGIYKRIKIHLIFILPLWYNCNMFYSDLYGSFKMKNKIFFNILFVMLLSFVSCATIQNTTEQASSVSPNYLILVNKKKYYLSKNLY